VAAPLKNGNGWGIVRRLLDEMKEPLRTFSDLGGNIIAVEETQAHYLTTSKECSCLKGRASVVD